MIILMVTLDHHFMGPLQHISILLHLFNGLCCITKLVCSAHLLTLTRYTDQFDYIVNCVYEVFFYLQRDTCVGIISVRKIRFWAQS